jgi:hypothetical protein
MENRRRKKGAEEGLRFVFAGRMKKKKPPQSFVRKKGPLKKVQYFGIYRSISVEKAIRKTNVMNNIDGIKYLETMPIRTRDVKSQYFDVPLHSK